mmetsp:Transcript_21209/g.63308  ORF Transcript_21209/g.63308 Transcript_21209/m.63308 type:complete len:220 (+) Transcript_21209:101-760(+)
MPLHLLPPHASGPQRDLLGGHVGLLEAQGAVELQGGLVPGHHHQLEVVDGPARLPGLAQRPREQQAAQAPPLEDALDLEVRDVQATRLVDHVRVADDPRRLRVVAGVHALQGDVGSRAVRLADDDVVDGLSCLLLLEDYVHEVAPVCGRELGAPRLGLEEVQVVVDKLPLELAQALGIARGRRADAVLAGLRQDVHSLRPRGSDGPRRESSGPLGAGRT